MAQCLAWQRWLHEAKRYEPVFAPLTQHHAPMSKQDIEACIRNSLEAYFKDLHGTEPAGMHQLLMHAVEKPLLEVVMQHADQNQSKAASWLGLNRNTLRKKLLEHHLAS